MLAVGPRRLQSTAAVDGQQQDRRGTVPTAEKSILAHLDKLVEGGLLAGHRGHHQGAPKKIKGSVREIISKWETEEGGVPFYRRGCFFAGKS